MTTRTRSRDDPIPRTSGALAVVDAIGSSMLCLMPRPINNDDLGWLR
jgi:hypothetical protein